MAIYLFADHIHWLIGPHFDYSYHSYSVSFSGDSINKVIEVSCAISIVRFSDDDRDPSSVIMVSKGNLLPCDAGGETPDWGDDATKILSLPPNNMSVIYELPTSWARGRGVWG